MPPPTSAQRRVLEEMSEQNYLYIGYTSISIVRVREDGIIQSREPFNIHWRTFNALAFDRKWIAPVDDSEWRITKAGREALGANP